MVTWGLSRLLGLRSCEAFGIPWKKTAEDIFNPFLPQPFGSERRSEPHVQRAHHCVLSYKVSVSHNPTDLSEQLQIVGVGEGYSLL